MIRRHTAFAVARFHDFDVGEREMRFRARVEGAIDSRVAHVAVGIVFRYFGDAVPAPT